MGCGLFYRIRHLSRCRRVLLCQRCYRYWGQMDVTSFGTRDWVWNICCSVAPAFLSRVKFFFDDRELTILVRRYFLDPSGLESCSEPICESYSSQSLIMNNSLVRLMLFVSLSSIRRFLAWLLNFTIFDNFKSRRMAKRMAVKWPLYNRMGLEGRDFSWGALTFLVHLAHRFIGLPKTDKFCRTVVPAQRKQNIAPSAPAFNMAFMSLSAQSRATLKRPLKPGGQAQMIALLRAAGLEDFVRSEAPWLLQEEPRQNNRDWRCARRR